MSSPSVATSTKNGRMVIDLFQRFTRPGHVLVAALAFSPWFAFAEPGNEQFCFSAGTPPFSDVNIQLTQTLISPDGVVSGVFRVSNRATGEALKIKGNTEAGDFWVDRIHSFIEFRDLNGSWKPLIGAIEHDPEPIDVAVIKPGATVHVRRSLFQRQVMTGASAVMRLVLPVFIDTESLCLTSKPFKMRDGLIPGVEQQQAQR